MLKSESPNSYLRLLASSLAAVAMLVGCRGEPQDASGSAERVIAQDPKRSAADFDSVRPVVRLETSVGAIAVRLDAEHAPGTVRNFLNYVTAGFYTGTLFHYVAADKMIVGGGFSADGQPKSAGPPIRNEAHNGLKNTRGTIAMARDAAAGIDTASSQFFINLADVPSFDHRGESADDYGYCVFGEVVEGLDIAERISRTPTRDGGGDLAQTPDPPVIVKSIRIIR